MATKRNVGFIPIFRKKDGAVYCRPSPIFSDKRSARIGVAKKGWLDKDNFLTIGKVVFRTEAENSAEG